MSFQADAFGVRSHGLRAIPKALRTDPRNQRGRSRTVFTGLRSSASRSRVSSWRHVRGGKLAAGSCVNCGWWLCNCCFHRSQKRGSVFYCLTGFRARTQVPAFCCTRALAGSTGRSTSDKDQTTSWAFWRDSFWHRCACGDCDSWFETGWILAHQLVKSRCVGGRSCLARLAEWVQTAESLLWAALCPLTPRRVLVAGRLLLRRPRRALDGWPPRLLRLLSRTATRPGFEQLEPSVARTGDWLASGFVVAPVLSPLPAAGQGPTVQHTTGIPLLARQLGAA